MKLLKQQIRESFFNPILYFLPALIFMVADDFWGENTAWKVSFPIAFAMMFYIYYMYKGMFIWHGMLAVCYLIIGFTSSLVPDTHPVLIYIDELTFILFILLMILQKKSLGKIASKALPYKLPMFNNENELFRVARVLMLIVIAFVFFSLYFRIFDIHKKEIPLGYLKYLYASTLIFAALFELIRVSIIRARLIREDWVPVVDESGRVTGSVQYRRDHPKEERLMHPQVRLYFLENGMIYLQQRKSDDINEPLLWDASLSRSVRMTESIDLVLNKYTKKLYNQDQQKFLFLTNYIYNGRFNDQYIYLFISCKTDELKPQKDEVFQTKWWTTRQIEDNLGKNIFTERFEKEYDILKRSGLLEQESCECECALRELVKNKNGQSSV